MTSGVPTPGRGESASARALIGSRRLEIPNADRGLAHRPCERVGMVAQLDREAIAGKDGGCSAKRAAQGRMLRD